VKKEVDVFVIGGGPAGIVSAVTTRKYYPEKKITLVKNVESGCIPCGIPYMFSSLNNPEENKLGNAALENNDIDLVIDEVQRIDRDHKEVITGKEDTFRYDKLILALGSLPITPPVPGIDKEGVYTINKDLNYLKVVVEKIKKSKHVMILGGGFIGVEFADEISKIGGLKVTLVEMLPALLYNSFDPEFSEIVEEKLVSQGIEVLTDTEVIEILGKKKVEKVRLSGGKEIEVDSIILGVGSVPNTQLAFEAGLDRGKGKGIWVDEYMRTSDADIFAVGDCAGKRDFYTRKDTAIMLASTSTAEARIAGANLFKLKVIRENKGTIAIYSTYINGLVLGSAGLTERTARKENFEVVIGAATGMDKHPATLPGANKIRVKLIFSRQSGILMGGQVSGGISAGEVINIIGLAIQQRVSATELDTLQIATHPYLTSAPTMNPLILAAQAAMQKI